MVDEKNDSGSIKISDDAIAAIACIAAKGVDGVSGLDGGAAGALAEALGVTDLTRGIRVSTAGESVSLDMNIIVVFGREISDIASEVQDRVKEAIEKMTGLTVEKIHVNINSVRKEIQLNNDFFISGRTGS
jgi:uncharacterized alkaline shock family protein YloU